MKKTILTLMLTSFLFVGFGLMDYAETAEKGTTSNKGYYMATPKVLPMGKERVQMNYEAFGVLVSDTGKGLFHNASIHVLGALHAVKGAYKDSGFMVMTHTDGDKVFATYKGSGTLRKSSKGTLTYVGGTGKYVGIQGSGEYTRYSLRPPTKGMIAAFSIAKSNWEVPETKK
jgi:hypothetical protein